MSKAYSSKALPAGTIIREWRLEDVLGVGGFGIVYKGRGIYFGELVAIKEYFPSSISERDAEDTVVPIGSDVEEVHALGLKKFVEEAKLLWNLSTPTRHPNIVSVRALFEIHGTAYMVMDFEDGVSLSKLLKEGRRFNERSLWNIIKPIAEGLDRAHRAGVLHRDIKPPNILITDDNRPVLIDFGSARFEAAEATSTTVTFHTPPYAAVEQYVKTYSQGPWTDIYALGVVLYECVTGEKPPEVLERMHGGLGKALAEGTWPGFSKRFLQAVDAAMTIRPTERPQSIREWLALFGKKGAEAESEGADEATRFFAHEVTAEEIIPVAPPVEAAKVKSLETQVPDDPREVQFKRAGEETNASKKKKKTKEEAASAAAAVSAKSADAAPAKAKAPAPAAQVAKDSPIWSRVPRRALLAGGGALALAVAVAAGTLMLDGGDSDSSELASNQDLIIPDAPVAISDVGQLASAERALAEEAQNGGAPATAVNGLIAAAEQLDKQSAELRTLLNDPAQSATATARADEMRRVAASANIEFANALLRDAEARAARLPSDARLRNALSSLRSTVQASATATDPGQSLSAARDAMAKSQLFAQSLQAASRRTPTDALAQAPRTAAGPTPAAPVSTAPAAVTDDGSTASTAGVSPAKLAQFNAIVDGARSMARQVVRMGNQRPGGAGFQTRKENARLASGYYNYLATLKDSMRGANSDREADRLIKQAKETQAYIVFLNKQSSQAQ